MLQKAGVLLANVLRATAACDFCTSDLQKVVRTCGVLRIFTCKCASLHSGVQFCRIETSILVFCAFWLANVLRATAAWHFWTSELPKWLRQWGVLYILNHFDLQMCFAPQPRGIFEHRNFQNGSDHEVFCAFWLANVLRATAACHFSPVCWTATSAPAALARLLFEHQEPRIIEKTQRFATSLTFFAHVPSF